MIMLHGINDNGPTPHLYYLDVYQDEAKKLELYKKINILRGLEPNPKTDKTVVHIFQSTLGSFNRYPIKRLKGFWV